MFRPACARENIEAFARMSSRLANFDITSFGRPLLRLSCLHHATDVIDEFHLLPS